MTGARWRGPRGGLGIGEALQLDVPDELVDALTPGQHIHHGQYLIHGVLGRGSFATVYDAEHLGLARRVAIKVPLLHVDKKALLHERFLREARTAALVQHPNVLAIYDAASLVDGTPFLVLERVDGDSLNERIAHGPLPIALVVEIGRQLAMALAALASAGIVHRDIKPANVMLHRVAGGVPQVKLVDLGVAKRRGAWQQPLRLTMQGELIGTPQYMASEQLRGEEADSRTDIYGVGAVLYEALTGRPPHESSNFSEFMVAALSMPLVPASALRADCPPTLERTLLRALERDRDQRYATPELLLADLEFCQSELEICEVELEECDLEGPEPPREQGDPVPVPSEPPPVLEAAHPPDVVSAPPPELPHLRPLHAPRPAQRGWRGTGKRALPSLPRLLLGLAALLLLLGGSGALVLPSASLPDEASAEALLDAVAAQPTPTAPPSLPVETPATPAEAQPTATGNVPPLPAADDSASERGAARVAGPSPQGPPAAPFAPRVELPGWEPAPALEVASVAGAALDGAQDARANPLEEPASEPAPRVKVAKAGRSIARSDQRARAAQVRPPQAPRASPGPLAVHPRPHAATAATAPVPSTPAATVEANGNPVDGDAALAGALKAFATGRLAEAKAAYQQVLRSDARSTAGLRGLGLVAARLGENDVARDALTRYLELAPRAPDAAQISSRLAALAP